MPRVKVNNTQVYYEVRAILAKAIPNAKLVYLENAAHELAEETEKVTRVSLEFLTKS